MTALRTLTGIVCKLSDTLQHVTQLAFDVLPCSGIVCIKAGIVDLLCSLAVRVH